MAGALLLVASLLPMLESEAPVVGDDGWFHAGPTSKFATVGWGAEPLVLSSTGDDNLLPTFWFEGASSEGGESFEFKHGTRAYKGGRKVWSSPGGEWKSGGSDYPDSCPDDLRGEGSSSYPNVSIPVDVFEVGHPMLPYLSQNKMGCERENTTVPVIVMESEHMRAAITPQFGGKIWSLFDKGAQRQMFFNNPAHQPYSIAYRDAWTSGGAEFNWSPGYVGHSTSTESDVFAASFESERGPVVRIWEYDRFNSSVWQVDILMANRSLFVHPKITNPNSNDIPGYWWSCTAMRTKPTTRIVTPADTSVFPCTPWPDGNYLMANTSFGGALFDDGRPQAFRNNDMSFIGNIPAGNDFFMYKAGIESKWPHRPHQPHITWVDEDGYSVIHGHPLNGTKFFTWGAQGTGIGDFQQDFLAAADYQSDKCRQDTYDPWCTSRGPRIGDYTELQIGPAATQEHVFPVLADSEYQWTEFYAAFQGDRKTMQDVDYRQPLLEVNRILDATPELQTDALDDMDAFMESLSDRPIQPSEILHHGSPWGYLHQELLKRTQVDDTTTFGYDARLAKGVLFPANTSAESRPWMELLTTGTFSEETLRSGAALSFMVDARWVALLSESVAKGHDTWLHQLRLGTAALEVGNIDAATMHLRRSMLLKPTVQAARALSLYAATVDEATALYLQAWEVWQAMPVASLDADADAAGAQTVKERLGCDLVSEWLALLISVADYPTLRVVLPNIAKHCDTCAQVDRYHHAEAAIALDAGDFNRTMGIIRAGCWPTYADDREQLNQLWWHANIQRECSRLNVSGAPKCTLSMMQTIKLKRRMGCDGYAESTLGPSVSGYHYGMLADSCFVGPPNVGYAY